jgi:transposase
MWKYWEPILTTFGNWEKEVLSFFDVIEQRGKHLTNAYTECQNGLTRAIDRLGRGYSFDAIRVKLLLAPKKEGIVTSYRTIRKRRQENPATREFMAFSRVSSFSDDGYEEVQVPERRLVTWGVDIAKLADWLEEQEKQAKRSSELRAS